MDFALLPSDTGGDANADADNQKYCYGSGFLKQDRAINDDEDDLRGFKMPKTSSCGEGSLQRSNGYNLSSSEMLSFSSPNPQPLTLPYYHYSSNAFARNSGINGLRGPFSPSQWMELEHQALIYKYITANVPIPSHLLNPIRKAFEVAGFSVLRSNPLGWNDFHLGFSNTDPEPGWCRRTDGKKWRCSRDAVMDQKYCERHMNRGRHRSRKPVEGQSGPSAKPTATRSVAEQTTTLSKIRPKDSKHQEWGRHEFGLVYSNSLVNPLRPSGLRQFMDQPYRDVHWTQLSISIPSVFSMTFSAPGSRELEMGLGLGNGQSSSSSNWAPISWEPSSIGGPLGEVLHNPTSTSDAKQLNLIERWDSPQLDSSPTGVLQRGAFTSLSNSSTASSPLHDSSTCNRIVNLSLDPAL